MAYKINTRKCLKCGLCVTQCPEKAVVVDKKLTEADGLETLHYKDRILEVHRMRGLFLF